MKLADRSVMQPNRAAVATVGDLQDLEGRLEKRFQHSETRFEGLETRFEGLEKRFQDFETRFEGLETRFEGLETRFEGLETGFRDLKEGLDKRFQDFEDRLTRSLTMEMGRIANVIMEHTTSLIRAAGDHPKAIEERLDAHVADQSVHLRPSRA